MRNRQGFLSQMGYCRWIISLSWLLASCNSSPESLPQANASQLPSELSEQYFQARKTDLNTAIYLVDSILAYIKANQLPDTLRIKFNVEKSAILIQSGRQAEALDPLLEGYLLAGLNQDSALIAISALQLADYYNALYQTSLTFFYNNQAAQYYQKYPSSRQAAKTLNNLGRVYLDKANYFKALEFFEQADQIYESHNDSMNIAYNLADIGYTLIQLNQEVAGLAATRRGISIAESIENAPAVGKVLGNLALNYKKFHPDTAIMYQQKAIQITAELGDSLNWIIAKYNFGNVLLDLKKFSEAERIYQEVYAFCKEKEIDQGIMISLNALGSLYENVGQYQKAISILQESDAMISKSGSTSLHIQNLQAIRDVQLALGDLEAAQGTDWKIDSLEREVKTQQTQNSLKYLAQNMDAERALVNQQLLEKQHAEAKAKIFRRNVIIGLILGFFILGALLWYRWNLEFQTGQQAINRLLARYAGEINTQITASSTPNYDQYFQKLKHLLEVEKIYLQSSLKTDHILERLEITYKELNHVLKEQLNTSFPQLINQYRINTAKELLAESAHDHLSLDEIAVLSGFGTRQNFHKTFLSMAGVSPGTFRTFFQQNRASSQVQAHSA